MRLKVSPKEAITTIDRLIYEGYEIYSSLRDSPSSMIDDINLSHPDRLKVSEWHGKVIDELTATFIDFTPVYLFLQPMHEHDDNFQNFMHSKRYSTMLKSGLQVLSGYYQGLSEQVYTPLFYISDRAQICFFASVCPLQPDSNEDALCRYMFDNHSFNEWVEMTDIFTRAFGGSADEYDKQDRAKVENAAEGVNKKTNEAFEFPVFRQKKTLLSLHLPSRFLRDERKNIAL